MIYIFIGFFGLALGSFVNALVWRLREQDLRHENSKSVKKGRVKSKRQEEKAKKHEVAATDLSILRGRSMCVHCQKTLAWFDLIPVLSWVQLKGRCRYCKKAISWQYPFVELAVGALAVVSYAWWPFTLETWVGWLLLGVWIVSLVPLTALVIYDIRWMEMPTKLIYSLNIFGVTFAVLLSILEQSWQPLVSGAVGGLLLGGFFWLMYQLSAGKWIGGGDVRYGFTMGIFLGWQKMLFGIMLASYLGVILIIVLIALRKYHKKMRIPFGPFLISATYIAMVFGQQVVDTYKELAGF